MISTIEEERKTYSRSHLEDNPRETRLSSLCRPTTSKKLETDFQKIPKRSFGRYNTGLKGKKFFIKDRNSPLISKVKPGKVSIDRERLYIENIELKMKNQELNKALIKFKARIIQLERDKNKKSDFPMSENPSNSSFLVHLLKKTIKDLKVDISTKDSEISKLKKNLKQTKIVEMELEVKAYIDECTRLKHHLEEVIQRTETGEFVQKEKILNDEKELPKAKDPGKTDKFKGDASPKTREDVKKLLKEIENLKDLLAKTRKELTDESSKLKKDLFEEKGKNVNLSFKLKEADKLIENLYLELKFTRQKKSSRFLPPKCLQTLFNLARNSGLAVEDFLKKHYGNTQIVSSSQFLFDLQEFDNSIKSEDLDRIIHYIQASSQAEILVERLLNFFHTFEFNNEDPFEALQVLEKINHLKYRMQLHRIEKEKFIENYFSQGKNIHMQELVLTLTKPPFNFSRQDGQIIANHVFESKKHLSFQEFLHRFEQKIGEWEVFSPKDEENFDTFLMSLVTHNLSSLEKTCSELDKDEKGFINVEDFFSCLTDLNLKIPEKIKRYLLVLFYSHNMEIDQVPYKQFFQAYISTEAPDEEEAKEDLTFKYLEEIAEKLLKTGKSVKDAFFCDEAGHILAEDFIKSLGKLGVRGIPKEDLLELMENLQNNKEDRVFCINLSDLEDIMENYGVPVPGADISEDLEIESLAAHGEGHVQKVSLLDSMQLDLQET
jgi:hypothetical protein